jgi:hypothetical protein
MLKYVLVENPMTTGQRSYIAHVSSPEIKTLEDVVNHIISEGTGLTRPQALAYFEKLTQSFLFFVSQGHHVITPLLKVRPTISGLFEDELDTFDASRHKVGIHSASGSRLRDLATNIKLEKVDIATLAPVPAIFTDTHSEEHNFLVTSGGIGMLRGKLLKFDPKDIQQGIFFIPVDDPGTEIRVSDYSRLKPAEVHFHIPVLESGDYRLVVKTIPRSGGELQEGKLKHVIIVE